MEVTLWRFEFSHPHTEPATGGDPWKYEDLSLPSGHELIADVRTAERIHVVTAGVLRAGVVLSVPAFRAKRGWPRVRREVRRDMKAGPGLDDLALTEWQCNRLM